MSTARTAGAIGVAAIVAGEVYLAAAYPSPWVFANLAFTALVFVVLVAWQPRR